MSGEKKKEGGREGGGVVLLKGNQHDVQIIFR